jgi:putative membrane protein
MSSALDHWSYDPFLFCAVAIAVWHELGLRRLLRRTRRDRVRRRRLRSLWFYGGLTVAFIAVGSPLEYWGYDYFLVHTIQHLLLMFAAPSLIAAGAPWQPLLLAVPLRLRRPALRALLHDGWSRPLRAARGLLLAPVVAVAAFNIVMVGWQIPGLLDLAERDKTVHIWLMNASMLLAGILFWVQIVASPPLRTRITPAGQAIALLATNSIMWVLAMSMSLFTHHSWYSVYNHIPGVTLPAFADQQLGAGILWVCGDLWAVPALILVVRRLIARGEGDVDSVIERILAIPTSRTRLGPR